MTSPEDWVSRQERLARLARSNLFFIGGAPRSGTTWLQRLLDSHPAIGCRGEGLFMQHLAAPLDAMMTERRARLDEKNTTVFGQAEGFPLPDQDDSDMLLATAILLALDRARAGRTVQAIGEKTPENVFLFPRLKRLFPSARLIIIARDPRDVLSSAWHFFHQPAAGEDPDTAKAGFIRLALPSLQAGTRQTLALRERYPADCMVVTYESLRAAPEREAAALFRFLGVSDHADTVAQAVARTAFTALSGGRPPGTPQDGAFLRSGIVGGWRATFTPAMSDLILNELGWAFPLFGWQP